MLILKESVSYVAHDCSASRLLPYLCQLGGCGLTHVLVFDHNLTKQQERITVIKKNISGESEPRQPLAHRRLTANQEVAANNFQRFNQLFLGCVLSLMCSKQVLFHTFIQRLELCIHSVYLTLLYHVIKSRCHTTTHINAPPLLKCNICQDGVRLITVCLFPN